MPYRKISRDVKLAAVNLYERNLLTIGQIVGCVGFTERTFWRIMKLWRETGDVVRHNTGGAGRPRSLHLEDTIYLLRLVNHRPDWFLDELLSMLETSRFISVHFTTIHRELARAGMSLKKLKRIARERNEVRRAEFVRRMAQYEPEEIGFLDETSKDERTLGRSAGRSLKGTRAMKKQVFVRGHCLSALGLLTVDGMMAVSVVEGSFTTAKFKTFIEEDVVSAFSSHC
jgi:transposase